MPSISCSVEKKTNEVEIHKNLKMELEIAKARADRAEAELKILKRQHIEKKAENRKLKAIIRKDRLTLRKQLASFKVATRNLLKTT